MRLGELEEDRVRRGWMWCLHVLGNDPPEKSLTIMVEMGSWMKHISERWKGKESGAQIWGRAFSIVTGRKERKV